MKEHCAHTENIKVFEFQEVSNVLLIKKRITFLGSSLVKTKIIKPMSLAQ